QHFLEAFIRAYVMAATMGRLQILNLGPEDGLLQVRDFVTRQSIAECEHPKRMLLSPYLNGVLCSLVFEPHNVREERPLFQLPRSYKFLRSFTEMTHEALGILNKTLEKMRRKEPV
ncbi:MAG TPA: hypothetical protein VN495_03420, partial [Candidatus Paceibacterota bacterium]|nr:hypothetical protein [Candidatus Paceibacterota bacterium]